LLLPTHLLVFLTRN